MALPPMFVQGFVDEIERQKLAKRQQAGPIAPAGYGAYAPTGAGPSGMIGQPGGRPMAAPVTPPAQRPRQVVSQPQGVLAPGSFGPPAPLPADHRMDEIENRRAAILEAPIGVVPEGALGPSYQPGMIQVAPAGQRPVVTPMDAGYRYTSGPVTQMANDSFETEQRSAAAVATTEGRIRGTNAAPHVSRAAELQGQMFTLQNELDTILAAGETDDQATYQRTVDIQNQLTALGSELNTEVETATDALGGAQGGGAFLQNFMAIAFAPGEWGAGKAGDIGFWYAGQQGDPGIRATVIGFIANSPLGAVLSADGVGVTDYVKWIEDHPKEVAYVQENGWTDPATGQHSDGGSALYNYYLTSLNIAQSVVAQGEVDPTSYVGLTGVLGRRLAGTTATRFLAEGAAGRRVGLGLVDEAVPAQVAAEFNLVPGTEAVIAPEGRVAALRRYGGGIVAAPEMIFDEAADRAVAGTGRVVRDAVGNTVNMVRDRGFVGAIPRPGPLASPVAQQVAGVVNQIDNVFRNRNVARRQLAEGETSAARPGVGPIAEDATGTATSPSNQPYQQTVTPTGITISDEEMLIPEVALQQRNDLVTRQTQAYQTGDIATGDFLGGEIRRLDARASYPVTIPPPPPPTRPISVPSQLPTNEVAALPQGDIPVPPPPDPRAELMNDIFEAEQAGDAASADILRQRLDEMQTEDAVEYDIAANEPAAARVADTEPPAPVAPRYATPDDVPIRDNPNYRRGTGPAEVGDGNNVIVVDYDDSGKKFTLYGPDEYPQNLTRPAAVRMAQREVYRIESEAASGGVARTAPVDAVTGEDFIEVAELEDGTWGGFLEGDETPLVTAATPDDVRAAVADLDTDDIPTGQETLPTDPQTQWRQFGVGKPKMVDAILDNADDYTERGLAPKVDSWLRWREDFVEDLNVSRGTPSETTPSLQSVTDRAEEEIAFARIVGEAPPAQTVSYEDVPANQIRRMPVGSSVADMAERATFDLDDAVATQARGWFRKQANKKISAAVDPAYGGEVNTYFDAADYLKWVRQRRQAALSGEGQIELLAAGAPIDLPSFRDIYRSITGNASDGRRLKRARLQSARAAAAARRRAPLPPGTTREPILSDAENRLLDTRISDLGQVGRSDVTKDGKTVVRGRNEGDTATVRSVYDSAHDNAIARGLTEEEAHQEGMKAVASRINADFGIDTDAAGNPLLRGIDTYTNYITMMARYGTPIATARAIQTDMVGDFVQAFLTEGPVTATEMILKTAGYVRRGFNWADTRVGEIAEKWGFDVASMSPREGIVKSEVGGNGPKSAVRKIFAPKIGKVDLDAKGLPNPGRGVASMAEVGRKLNDQMEMGRRTGLKASIVDSTLMREKKTFAQKIGTHRRLAGVPITDDDLAATIADLGSRFSPEDVRLAMERLANAKGATKDAAANFGERVGRDWANIRNAAADNAKLRVNKALFSYEFTNADEMIRRFIPFHYWSSRAIPFYVETAIRNPAFALAYYRMAEGLSERAEAEGWPESLRFMAMIWSGPMGYMFFADPAANMGLLGVTEMLFPADFDDGNTSSVGRWLQIIQGRGGVGVTPAITTMMAYSGLLGEDTRALDPTGTWAARHLTGALLQLYEGTVGGQTLLGSPVSEALARGRAYTSKWFSKWLPGARYIPTTDQDAYPKLQVRNDMIDLRMQEQGYTDESQLTESDWEVINTEFETQEGPLYEDAVTNFSLGNAAGQGIRVLSGPVSVRQEGQFARQTRDNREALPGGSTAEPGQPPTAAQAYETSANLHGKYGRTAGGLSLPEYDPYNDNVLTEGEKQFMELWQAETGEAYTSGDLETLREGREYTQAMARTDPGAAPYVAGEMGYYNLGEESASPLIDQYYNIMFAAADTGTVIISGREWGPKRLAALTDDERSTLAEAWLTEHDTDGSAHETLRMRETWADAHPEYAAFKAWAKEIRSAYEGDIGAYRNALIAGNPNAARYFENAARAARETVNGRVNPSGVNPETKRREGGTGGTATTEAYYAELDRRTLNLDAYLAINGIQRTLDDPRPLSTGDASATPGPFDPRPAGWSADGGGSGGQSGGGAGGAGTDDSSSRIRETWATETIAATEAGVAQANALLTQQMGYPVDIANLPPPIKDAALAMLPPGLIPEDSWLYFDYLAWQAHQRLGNGPTDLLSYLAATSNGREWKAQRTVSYAGGAELVGQTPATTYYPGQDSAQGSAPSNIPGGSYAAYLAGA